MAEGDLTVHQAIAEIINELGGIGKTGHNKDQNYDFRGIDAVLINLHPLFAKYGVFMAPDVLERHYEERTSKSGNVGHCCHLHIRYTVYGPTGDSFAFSTWGEGLDYSDKATNKAMTAAFKYALFQLFAICDPAEDGDSEGGEGGSSERSELTTVQYFIRLLDDSGFTNAVQSDIILTAIGHRVRDVAEMSEEEVNLGIQALEAAIVDRDQLQEETK